MGKSIRKNEPTAALFGRLAYKKKAVPRIRSVTQLIFQLESSYNIEKQSADQKLTSKLIPS
ncbi:MULTISPECIES: hypothetical protein [Porphyromonas]|uniref:Transposase n=1 Tax=Porphyromonas canoris TaxID=36875 RepID=A0ABR4XLD4_9PORP|nr:MULTISPECIES: hypothetical protein [Porphyromonas]KGL53104.1 hypothetical protein HQ29_03110 [Porphyromonas canoris]KGN69228.1 hypothetical protein JT26_05435 [Porphyromonas sp. COT-108 OH1349]KGN92534.1 hypothetical protein HQ43_04600 [Porphyromonas canoris]KGN95219.1 hypothetical protein HQ39_06875 [Porphyromonas sp. COT-108 OH2963]